MTSKFFILLLMWSLGWLHCLYYRYRNGVGDEGYLWVFKNDKSQAVRASKFLFVITALSSFLIFFAIDLKLVLAICGTLLFSSTTVLSFRNS